MWHPTLHRGELQHFISHTYSQLRVGEHDQLCRAHGIAYRNRVNNQGLWEASFVVSRGWGVPRFLWKDVIILDNKQICILPQRGILSLSFIDICYINILAKASACKTCRNVRDSCMTVFQYKNNSITEQAYFDDGSRNSVRLWQLYVKMRTYLINQSQ